MKKFMLLMLCTVFGTAAVMAQPAQKDYKKDQAEWEQKLKDKLDLTADQAVKYDAINKEYKEKMDALKQDAGLSDDARKEKKTALKKEKEAKLFEFFTPKQQEKYREVIEEKKKEMEKKSPGA
jgi:hypothetical protein